MGLPHKKERGKEEEEALFELSLTFFSLHVRPYGALALARWIGG